jgi:hypothetical protein
VSGPLPMRFAWCSEGVTMKTKPKWTKKLTAKDLRHVAEGSGTGRASLRSLKENLTGQASTGIVCWECRSIVAKVGVVA